MAICGPVFFGTSASYRAGNQTTVDLARVVSDQLGVPVEDETGFTGKYDISLRWTGTSLGQAGNHGGAWSGAPGTPATMVEAATRPALPPTPPAPLYSTLSSSNSD